MVIASRSLSDGHQRPLYSGKPILYSADATARALTMTAIPLETLVTVFGGSGFLGRHVVRALAKLGYRIRVAVRRPELAGYLQPLGRVGQIHAVQANLRYPGFGRGRRARRRRGDQSGRHPVRARTADDSMRCKPSAPRRSRSRRRPSARA